MEKLRNEAFVKIKKKTTFFLGGGGGGGGGGSGWGGGQGGYEWRSEAFVKIQKIYFAVYNPHFFYSDGALQNLERII